jgi:hypothetical protein
LQALSDYLTSNLGRQYQRHVDPRRNARCGDHFACFDDSRACRFHTKDGELVESCPMRGPHGFTATSKVDGLRLFI